MILSDVLTCCLLRLQVELSAAFIAAVHGKAGQEKKEGTSAPAADSDDEEGEGPAWLRFCLGPLTARGREAETLVERFIEAYGSVSPQVLL